MIVIKDSMVLIHLAKLGLLEGTTKIFKKILIPKKVYTEVNKGKGEDAMVINELVKKSRIHIKEVDKQLVARANQFNIQGGEAEAVALYWEAKADLLATDDDNVRKKKMALDINIIGTPAIILKLKKLKVFDKGKITESIKELGKIGWFSRSVIDKMLVEVEK